MNIAYRVGYASAFITWLSVVMFSGWAYVYHVAFTVMNASSVEHSGYLFYLLAGIFFPPLGIFNSLFIWFG